MHMWNGGFFGMGWIWMIFIWLIIIAVIIVVVVLVLNSLKQNQVTSPGKISTHEKAVEKLKERYAAGEISREEYKQMMDDLKE